MYLRSEVLLTMLARVYGRSRTYHKMINFQICLVHLEKLAASELFREFFLLIKRILKVHYHVQKSLLFRLIQSALS